MEIQAMCINNRQEFMKQLLLGFVTFGKQVQLSLFVRTSVKMVEFIYIIGSNEIHKKYLCPFRNIFYISLYPFAVLHVTQSFFEIIHELETCYHTHRCLLKFQRHNKPRSVKWNLSYRIYSKALT